MIFSEYQNDLKTKRAVERNIEIIGEAVNRILKDDPNYQIEKCEKYYWYKESDNT